MINVPLDCPVASLFTWRFMSFACVPINYRSRVTSSKRNPYHIHQLPLLNCTP